MPNKSNYQYSFDGDSEDPFIRSILIKIYSLRIHFFLYGFQTIIFTYMLYWVIRNHWHALQKSLKVILIFFEILLVMAWTNNAIMSWGMRNESLQVQYSAYVETFIFDNINGSFFLILFYKVLYTFKSVEV